MKIYRGNGWTIINAKWEDAELAEVDAVISDPPYDARTHGGGRSSAKAKGREISGAVDLSFPPVDPATIGPPLVALARRWAVLFCAVEQLGHYQAALGHAYIRSGVWVKAGCTPQFTGDRPAQWGEAIAMCHRKGRKKWNGGGHRVFFNNPTVPSGKNHPPRLHETQKPLSIMIRLVELFSNPGEIVLDPYCGSATTGVACLRRGRDFIGCEMQPHYAEIAAERLAAEERGLTVQAARAGQISILDIMEKQAQP